MKNGLAPYDMQPEEYARQDRLAQGLYSGWESRHLRLGRVLAALVAIAAFPAAGAAQDLVYRPLNPSFGGNPGYSAHLLGIASAQRTATARDAPRASGGLGSDGGTTTPGSSDADLFVRQLQGRLLSALAAQVTDAIFGENPQEHGLVTFGTTTVAFDRSIDSITLLITNTLDGTTTEIIVPQLVTGNS